MYSSKIIIDNKKYIGILDFWALKKVQEDLKELGQELKIHEIFESLSDIKNIKMEAVMSILLFSIVRGSRVETEEVEDKFLKDKFDIDKFNILFEYINSLILKCMPMKSDTNEEELFEFEEDIKDEEDWDFPYMEYLWYSVLKRTDDFYSITPKNFFSQMDIYKKMNNVKTEKVEYL